MLLTKDKSASLIHTLMGKSTGTKSSLRSRVLELFEFRLVAEWQHLSVRELFRVKGLDLTASKIRKLLKEDLSVETIEKSISLLKSLSLIKKNKKGEMISLDEQIVTQNDIPESAVRFYHEQKLDHAKKRLSETSVEEREYQSLVLLIRPR